MFAPVPSLDPHAALLADAAFGARPGTAAAELPAARDAREAWLRAVALGGQGRYAAARAELRGLTIHRADPVLASLAAAARGSLLRQLGWHAVASGPDGAAAAVVLPGLAEEQSGGGGGPGRRGPPGGPRCGRGPPPHGARRAALTAPLQAW
ncbi:hypothetical protein [Nocardia cyriacigeorgica]|uniref:hypothetical protein n=1 Tax=Nocardia cyriacigeorgica TaxID=135487 RepID=UPI0024574854|nr:hypothetical protein [Nocardia cyriacigeorgica]